VTWASEFVEFAASNLTSAAREALWARGVSDAQISLYNIGYLDRDLPDGPSEHFVEWAKNGSKLDDVFVLPLTNTLGEVKGFQFRHVDRERSGYMDYFLDRRESVLFGLGQAVTEMWATRSVYLVEGAFDLFPVQRTFPAVVATLTASPNTQLIRILRRLVQKVWVGYDMDAPGQRGAQEFKANYGDEFTVYIVAYPKVKKADGKLIKDPGDLWEAWGDAQLGPFIKSITTEDIFL